MDDSSTAALAESFVASRGELIASHERLAGIVAQLGPDDVSGPSYDDDWTIAQVLSHLGSGSAILIALLDRVRTGEGVPSMDTIRGIWDEWNAKSPQDQARDGLASDEKSLDLLGAVTEEEAVTWSAPMFGAPRTLPDMLDMRVGEHAAHTWDIDVMRSAAAVLSPGAVALLIDRLERPVSRSGKLGVGQRVTVVTTDPAREFVLVGGDEETTLTAADGPEMAEAAEAATGEVRLPAEAFVRLVYGRLDADHTPAGITADGIDLDTLRAAFPGF